MRIHIFGASGSGVTTLGNALAKALSIPYFDSDQYFWIPTNPPFRIKRLPIERNELIRSTLITHEDWIYGGSSVSWGEDIFPVFDFIIFLWLPPEIRMKRLEKREFERYGSIIYTDTERIKKHQEFMEWAASYDSNAISFTGRSLRTHEDWLSKNNCKILEIRGDFTVAERIKQALAYI